MLVNRKIFSISDDLSEILANLQPNQRAIVSETGLESQFINNNWIYNLGGDFYLTANSMKYVGGSWIPLSVRFAVVRLLGLIDEWVTTPLPIGQDGHTELIGFINNSIVGALNELKAAIGTSEWTRFELNSTLDVLIPKTVVDKEVLLHTASGLMDSNSLVPIRLASAGHTELASGFGIYSASIYSALNYLLDNISGGVVPGGVNNSIQYNNNGVFGGSEVFTYNEGVDGTVILSLVQGEFPPTARGLGQVSILCGDSSYNYGKLLLSGISEASAASALIELSTRQGVATMLVTSDNDLDFKNTGTGSIRVNGVKLLSTGSTSHFLNAAGNYVIPPGSPPGGINRTVQFNDNGEFNGNPAITIDGDAILMNKGLVSDPEGSGQVSLAISNGTSNHGELNLASIDNTNGAGILLSTKNRIAVMEVSSTNDLDFKNTGLGKIKVNGVKLKTDQTASKYLNGEGEYTTPAGGSSPPGAIEAWMAYNLPIPTGVQTIAPHTGYYDAWGVNYNAANHAWVSTIHGYVSFSANAKLILAAGGDVTIMLVYLDDTGLLMDILMESTVNRYTSGVLTPCVSGIFHMSIGWMVQVRVLQTSGYTATLSKSKLTATFLKEHIIA